MVGYHPIIGPRRVEIRQRLQRYGITPNAFPEYVSGTRFDLKFMLSISDMLGKFETFRNEKVTFSKQTSAGGESQIIVTRPLIDEGLEQRWNETIVQATSAGCESTEQIGASCVFGFQLYKQDGAGPDVTTRASRWSCLSSDREAERPWTMPPNGHHNRNNRRNMPPGIGTERFRGLGKRQDYALQDVVRRMIKTQR
jgi:hypothetical protein